MVNLVVVNLLNRVTDIAFFLFSYIMSIPYEIILRIVSYVPLKLRWKFYCSVGWKDYYTISMFTYTRNPTVTFIHEHRNGKLNLHIAHNVLYKIIEKNDITKINWIHQYLGDERFSKEYHYLFFKNFTRSITNIEMRRWFENLIIS